MDVTELQLLGFAEGLSIEPPRHASSIVARLGSTSFATSTDALRRMRTEKAAL
jgi:hypothetical protein